MTHVIICETGETIIYSQEFAHIIETNKPYKCVENEIICKSGKKLINLLTHNWTDWKFRQKIIGTNFTWDNIEYCRRTPYLLENDDKVACIPLEGKKGWGRHAMISVENLDAIRNYNWHLTEGNYAKSKVGLMHRYIMSLINGNEKIAGYVIDHINGNRLDNRITNLRIKTAKGNAKNKINDPLYEHLIGVQAVPDKIGMYQCVHKGISIMEHNDPRYCAMCHDSVVTYCYGSGVRLNDNKSKNVLPLEYWNLSYDIIAKLNSFKAKHTDFEGVSSFNGSWKASIKVELGVFNTEKEAAEAYDAAVKIFRLQKHLNFEDGNENEGKMILYLLGKLFGAK